MTRAWAVVLLVATNGCHTHLTRLYDGPTRPRAEIATVLRGSGAEILGVDSYEGDAFEFHVLPGCHYVWVHFHREFLVRLPMYDSPLEGLRRPDQPLPKEEYTSDALFAVELRAGHYYEITSTFTGDVFLPRLLEYDATGERLFAYSPAPPTSRGCAYSTNERMAAGAAPAR